MHAPVQRRDNEALHKRFRDLLKNVDLKKQKGEVRKSRRKKTEVYVHLIQNEKPKCSERLREMPRETVRVRKRER